MHFSWQLCCTSGSLFQFCWGSRLLLRGSLGVCTCPSEIGSRKCPSVGSQPRRACSGNDAIRTPRPHPFLPLLSKWRQPLLCRGSSSKAELHTWGSANQGICRLSVWLLPDAPILILDAALMWLHRSGPPPATLSTPAPSTGAQMPPSSVASPLSECGSCLLIMTGIAFVAGLFIVISAILCDRVFRGSLPSERRGLPSVWRQGGTLWIEPSRSRREPDLLSRPSETVPLWIQRSNDWFLEQGSCDSPEDTQMETQSPSSSAPFWDDGEPTWRIQPRVTLQDLESFFQHSGRGT
ncbi:transmembrane protein C16orf54 homolog [Podarcis raffonei]|nr:transmembrane protein C16orf54 homolog [Podarcis raffonei]